MNESGSIHFPSMEEAVLKRWSDLQIFQKSLDATKKKFSFYDGPPFASGLPHYGHFLASTLKDIVPRYWTMRGYHVERRWGWDCHGLPIEQEIDKKYQFKSAAEIEKFGIAKYNEECRKIVLRFVEEWRRTINRLGRWADFDNDYKTMDRDFMESVWWVIQSLWKKGLIYRGYKVMPFSTALGTPLSNFEAGLNYMDVQDPAITVTFPLKVQPEISFLAWTTTPWTLPSNLALAVGKDIPYVLVETVKEHKKFIVAEALVGQVFKKDDIASTTPKGVGKDLVGIEYLPLFPFFAKKFAKPPYFTVLESQHVTTDAGTGIVHMAPGFGQEDFEACKKVGIQTVVPVDTEGRLTSEVPDYAGLYVKDADKKIIADLKHSGRLYKQETIQHAYPFCYRTDTPLLNRAVSSWFVAVEKIKDRIVENNQKYTHWIPEHIRDGRFGKWLDGAKDWAISRNRYWGNPLPIFESYEDPESDREYFCVGSIEELEKISKGHKFTDIHREYLDDIVVMKNGKKYRRVREVLDCWFESGSMPYAQQHYPFEQQKEFEAGFPAQFIAEGVDQTRGWFYTLSVLGTILFDRPPFENVIVNGLILAEDGKKMSKRLKNYPDPHYVMDQYGADALRLYLIDSPVIRAEELRFSESGVKEIVRRVLLKWWHAYSFFESYAKVDGYQSEYSTPKSKNILDRWILSRLQTLLANIEEEMTKYHLYSVVPELLLFIEDLTNTYIRLNRARFWEEGFTEDKKNAFDTLHFVLGALSKMMAPFTPFLADHLYLLLTPQAVQKESVHLDTYPRAQSELIDRDLEHGVKLLEEVILLARNLREQQKIKVKIPLQELVVVHRRDDFLAHIKPLENYLLSELNVKKIAYRNDEESFVTVAVKANGASLGKRVGAKMGELSREIAKLGHQEIQQLDSGKTINLVGFELTSDDLRVYRTPVKGAFPVGSSSLITVALDTRVERAQELEGLAREVVNRIQKLRKESRLQLDDRIELQIDAKDAELAEAVSKFATYIQEQTLALKLDLVQSVQLAAIQDFEVDGHPIQIGLQKTNQKSSQPRSVK